MDAAIRQAVLDDVRRVLAGRLAEGHPLTLAVDQEEADVLEVGIYGTSGRLRHWVSVLVDGAETHVMLNRFEDVDLGGGLVLNRFVNPSQSLSELWGSKGLRPDLAKALNVYPDSFMRADRPGLGRHSITAAVSRLLQAEPVPTLLRGAGIRLGLNEDGPAPDDADVLTFHGPDGTRLPLSLCMRMREIRLVGGPGAEILHACTDPSGMADLLAAVTSHLAATTGALDDAGGPRP